MSWVYNYYWGGGATSTTEDNKAENNQKTDDKPQAQDQASDGSDLLIPEEVSLDHLDHQNRHDTSMNEMQQQPSLFFDHASRIEHLDDNG